MMNQKAIFTQQGGIRQGDPISPFLFLICTEGLHGLLTQSAVRGDILGFLISRRSPTLTHLLFADDSLLFSRSNVDECEKVLEVLLVYEQSSGQQINKAKTIVFFSKSTMEEERQRNKNILGVEEIRSYEKYLGFPSLEGKKQKKLASIILRKEYGGNYKVVKSNYYHKWVGKSLSKRWCKQFLPTP